MSEPGKIRHLSRKDLGKGLLGIAAGSALYFLGEKVHDNLIEPIRKLNGAWEKAQSHTVDSFLDENKQQLTKVRLGCSFSPEQMKYLGVAMRPQEAVKFIKEQLGMQDVRLSFRFENLLQPDGSISFKYYDEYIQEFISQGFSICWNIDTFKVSRYPEHHFEKFLPKNINIPPPNTEVQLDNPLAKWVLEFNEKLYAEFEKKYHINDRIKKGDLIQGINEPFTCAGGKKLSASIPFLRANILALHKYFSEAKLVINSPGVPNVDWEQTTLQLVDNFIEQMIKEDATLKDKLVNGFDWYGATPNGQQPLGATRQLDMNAVVEMKAGSKYLENRKQKMIPTQGTEIQWEPWGDKTRPGNYLDELIFALIRSLQVCDTANPTLLSLWGVENHLLHAKDLTGDYFEMRDLIKQINQRKLFYGKYLS